jgi:hypothetical protein
MSETVWILVMVGAWVVVMTAISVAGASVKQSDRAQASILRSRRVDKIERTAPRPHAVSGR